MGIGDKVRDAVLSWLRLTPATRQQFEVQEEFDFNANAFMHATWYGGSAFELSQFYEQTENRTQGFWASKSSNGHEIRKIHTGLPRIIVNTLTDIVLSDLNDIEIEDKTQAETWEAIAKENKSEKLLKKATKQALYIGDGAFKISIDTNLTKLPIIEWFPGDRVDFVYERGRLRKLVFKTEYTHKEKKYVLKEHYGFGFVKYELYQGDKEVGVDAIPDTASLKDVTWQNKTVMLGIPYIIHESERWEGRGQSVFEGKTDNFDSLDEAWSQWVQAMRASRPNKYIPESLIPRDPSTGGLIRPNPFDNEFIRIGDDDRENGKNEITLHQPNFPSADYLSTYITALDLCLQGLISPSTLGIDVKKLDNAEAQREKEKATLYSRNAIIEALTPTIQALVTVAIQAKQILDKRDPSEVDVEVTFGEYANPSFEAVVETLSNPNTPMSIEAKVDELWGDTKDDDWKKQEIARIKEQSGIVTMEEPALRNPLPVKEGAEDGE